MKLSCGWFECPKTWVFRSPRLQRSRDRWSCCRFAPYFWGVKAYAHNRSWRKRNCRHVVSDKYFLKFQPEVA